MTWTHTDLSTEELRAIALHVCDCACSGTTGTLNGYRCSAHRAEDELRERGEV